MCAEDRERSPGWIRPAFLCASAARPAQPPGPRLGVL
jgi:hypothetical protein